MIDFSCKHNVWIQNDDGTKSRMDEPYFRSKRIAEGTWQILSSGDYSYLLVGEEHALAIDSGYGAGNIREYMEELCGKPVPWIANTHDHFDHTANNSYFDLAFMSEATKPLATIPFPSFEGIDFPRDYPVQTLNDGDVIPLKGREIRAFLLPDHAVGSLVFLDRKQRILFSGDEFIGTQKNLRAGMRSWTEHLRNLSAYRDQFDRICGGSGCYDGSLFDHYLACMEFALTHDGEPYRDARPWDNQKPEMKEPIVYNRMEPHPEDRYHPEEVAQEPQDIRRIEHEGITVIFNADLKRE